MSNGLMTSTITEEKVEMRGLNDRLASYISLVRSLKASGPGSDSKYHDAMKQLEDEINKMKKMYDAELDRLRRLLEDANRQKHQALNSNDKSQALIQELQKRLAQESDISRKAQDELQRLQRAMAQKEKELADLRAQAAELERVRPDYCRLQRENDDMKKRLEDEKARRAAAEDALKQASDKSGFDRKAMEQRNRELQERLKAANDIIASLEAKVRQLTGGTDELSQMLKKLRESTAEELRRHQRSTEDALNKSLAELKNQQEQDARDKEKLMKENEHLKDCLRQMQAKMAELESQLAGALGQNDSLKRALDAERAKTAAQIRELNDRARDLQDQLMNKLKDFNDARDAQASLRAEIETYRKLLDGEDGRNGSRGGGSPSYGQKPGSALPDINGKGGSGGPPNTAPGFRTTYRVSYNREYRN